jgi:hypothetical protein
MPKTQKTENYAASLQESFARWESIQQNGCNDPFGPDGCGLNLVRNHIIYDKRKIENTMPLEEYPEIYFRETPPEIDNNYMARTDEIRANANAALECYKTAPGYKSVLHHTESPRSSSEGLHIARLAAKSVAGLEEAIKNGDLITMRRHEDPSYVISLLAQAIECLRGRQSHEGQISLFDYNEDEDEMEL